MREREDGDTKIPSPGAAALTWKSPARGKKQGPQRFPPELPRGSTPPADPQLQAPSLQQQPLLHPALKGPQRATHHAPSSD